MGRDVTPVVTGEVFVEPTVADVDVSHLDGSDVIDLSIRADTVNLRVLFQIDELEELVDEIEDL